MKLIIILSLSLLLLPLLFSLPHEKKRKKHPPTLLPLIRKLKKLCGPDLSLCEIKKKVDLERRENEEERGRSEEEGRREGGEKENGESRKNGEKDIGRFLMRRPTEKEKTDELNDEINKSFVTDEGFV